MKGRTRWWIVAAVAVVAAAAIVREFGEDRAPATPLATPAAVTGRCEDDAHCVGLRHVAAAATACRASIEDLAGFGVRWTDASAAPAFRRFAWRNAAGGPVTFSGDAADFRNAAGDYAPVTYECDFDPVAGKALDTRVRPGRLP